VLSRSNHSCAPNLAIAFEAGLVVAVSAVRDVAAGDELFLGYIASEMGAPTSKRREVLRERYNFVCDCERCGKPPSSVRPAADAPPGNTSLT
jgi:SET domain-containing protein